VPEEYFNLGGKTKWYGAALLRYGSHEFEAEPDFQCLPWPIRPGALAPYYEQAEQLLGVRRFAIEPDLQAILDRVCGANSPWKSEPLPLGLGAGILAHPHEARHFDGFASVRRLKGDAQSAFIDAVADGPALTVMTGAEVRALNAAAAGAEHVTGVTLANGETVNADTVLLAAGALHSPRLLQRYLETTGLHRRLPAYAQVGCNFKRHLLTALLAIGGSVHHDPIRKTALLLNDAYPHSSVQPLGFDGELIATLFPRFVPGAVARACGARAYGFFLQTEEGSSPANRVRAANGQGLPILDYDPARLPGARAEHRALTGALRRALLGAGYVSFVQAVPLTGTAHACGTLVAGDDPNRSVVDASGRVHGLDNVYVVDGSVLPRSSRVNPSLTIYAWALRVAAGLCGRGEP
jgi:choline dehydrogenase-like flavoprotein